MSNGGNHNRPKKEKNSPGRLSQTPGLRTASGTDALQFSRESLEQVRHVYVHIPFCARICPYCAFYKDLLDRSQTARFCKALVRDLDQQCARFVLSPETIYF